MNQNNSSIQNVFEYFQSQVFKIPSDIRVEIVTLPNSLILKTKKSALNIEENREKLKTILNKPEILIKLQDTSKGTSSQSLNEGPKVSFKEGGSTIFFLKFSGPLGSTLINLQKFDKFGLCFFEIKQSESSAQTFLKVSIKNLKKPSTQLLTLENQEIPFHNETKPISSDFPLYSGKNRESNKTSLKISEKSSAFFHLFNSIYKQTVEGLLQGYVFYLELHGVGFRGTLHEKKILPQGFSKKYIEFKLGQSHDIFYEIPNNIQVFMVKPTLIGLYGIDKENVSHVAASIRNLKLPDSYKGKGIRYKDEIIKTKIGKKK